LNDHSSSYAEKEAKGSKQHGYDLHARNERKSKLSADQQGNEGSRQR